ncbi:unnamed protein product [Orchesella dallaii]|uniref:SCP domain-containing protein n=1 Tax=Orchesella dallaii TaxID=48710 RepID=A0ABP1RUX4_9HEXA
MVKDRKELWKVAVEEHNKYRRRHGVPDIKGDDEKIHSVAQRYAEYLASNDRFQHSSGTGYGENLAGALGADEVAAIRFAVKMWYDEISRYNYGYPGFSMSTGHFTAVVWKSTTHVGIGVAYNSRKRWWVVVGNYNPPGNFEGRFQQNVPRLLSQDEIKRIEKERNAAAAPKDEEKAKEVQEEPTKSTAKTEEKKPMQEVIKKKIAKPKSKKEKAGKLSNELWQLAVDEHNKYRRKHGAPNLKGDDEKIHKAAQNHASYLAQYSNLVHANNGYAESLAAVQAENNKDAIKKAIKQWYNEKSHYNFSYPNFYPSAGHFTHMVWKASTHVGIGVAHNKSMGWWVVVANYTPRGNVMTQFRDNVLREGDYSEEEEEDDEDDEEEDDDSEEEASAKMDKLNIKGEESNDSWTDVSESNEEASEHEEEVTVEEPEDQLNSVMRVAVDEHNKYRRRHGVPDMKPSDELHGIAQRYAEYLASHDLFQHSQTHYENLAGALGETKEDAIRYAVKMWYDENKVYNYSYGGFSMQTGHFTAMIWKTTTNIGIGVAYNPRKRWWIVVGNYSPPGNVSGQFQLNVLPPRN